MAFYFEISFKYNAIKSVLDLVLDIFIEMSNEIIQGIRFISIPSHASLPKKKKPCLRNRITVQVNYFTLKF